MTSVRAKNIRTLKPKLPNEKLIVFRVAVFGAPHNHLWSQLPARGCHGN